MADSIVDDAWGITEPSTTVVTQQTPSSSDAVETTTSKVPSTQPIDPTTTVGTAPPHSTSPQSRIALHSSYGDPASTTDHFPMQHATEQLPPNPLPVATTDYVSDDTATTVASKSSSSQDTVTSNNVSTSASVPVNSDIPSSSTDQSDTPSSTDSAILSHSSLESSLVSSSSSSSSLSKTVSASQSVDTQLSITSPSSVHPYFTDTSPPTISDYVPSTGDILTPLTASRTSSTSSLIPLDTVSVKTTSAVPLSPPPNIKPVTPDSQTTSILGGGLSDYIVYVGAPLCGLGILILLIVCILCLRKRKAKSKGSPAKTQVQDLWVNSQPEIPLCNRSPLLEARVGDRHVGEKDLADSNLRRRKPVKTANASPIETVKACPEDLYVACIENDRLDDVEDDTKDCHVEDLMKEPEDEAEGCTTYEAVFDFPAEQDTHLSLQQGDLVKVTRKEDNGWWRGTVDDHIGWFPSNYVQAMPQDKIETENEVEMHNESHLSSFLARKNYESSSPRNSYPTEEEIEAEPIYCKIQPKEKRKSTPKIPDKVMPPHQLVNRENTPIPIEDGSRFKANCSYDGHFTGELQVSPGDVIVGKEQDRNGWMNGYNETTGEEGWFPAVYVDKITPDEGTDDLDTDLASYKHLEANVVSPDGQNDLVGIVHRATHTFEAEKAGDLEFEDGDLITVFQVLENGWWLGCKDKTVGWFPGSYVQMIDQPSPQPSPGSGKTSPSSSPDSRQPISSTPSGETTPRRSKLRPVRKAPPPPTADIPPESKIPSPVSKIPKKSIPVRTTSTGSSEAPNTDSVTEPDVTVENNNDVDFDFTPEPIGALHDGLYDLLNFPGETQRDSKLDRQDPSKPQVPKRYIKPKLVTIPRSHVNLPNDGGLHSDNSRIETPRSRPPPPPRPNRPRLGPLRVKLVAPRSPGHMSQSEDEETGFFHLNNQANVNEILRQDSSEAEVDANPYNGMSSFGLSSFGSSFGKRDEKPVKPVKPTRHYDVSPALTRAEEQSKRGESVHEPDNMIREAQTLNYTSPIVFNDDKSGLRNDSFVINTNDSVHSENEFKADENVEPSMPLEHMSVNENIDRDDSVLNQNSAEIPVTPNTPKKKDKPSRLAPPKPVTLSLENTTDQGPSNKPQSVDSSESNTSSPGMSKLPKAVSVGEPVSKLPVLGRKDTPVKSEEHRPQQSATSNNAPLVSEGDKANVNRDSPVYNKSINELSATLDTKSKDEVNTDYSSEGSARSRTDSFGSDRPPVAPKPKSKGLPKLLPKPKADQKSSPRDIETEFNVDKGNTSDSSPPTTPGRKQAPDTFATDEKAKEEDEIKPTKLPLGSKIAQKSPKPRGRRSQIPASPGMRTKSTDRQEILLNAGKASDGEEAPSNARKVSESDSDAPLSPMSNIRRKPESPSGARRVQKGDVSLRNRSNSPHERRGIPVSLKQRSNSPASKLPRSGLPKPNTSSPASTPTSSNGPTSGLVQPRPVVLDQQGSNIPSPKSGPNSRDDTTPSPDSFNEVESHENLSPKPERPNKPPQVKKQKNQDGKPKQGKSLLPVIHKNMDAVAAQNGVSPSSGGKTKRGIPVAKPPRPPAPKTPPETQDKNEVNKRTLYQAVKAYRAQSEEELSFTEGTFIKELSDCDRPGWFVGMLADGTTGLYPGSHLKPSPLSAQSEA